MFTRVLVLFLCLPIVTGISCASGSPPDTATPGPSQTPAVEQPTATTAPTPVPTPDLIATVVAEAALEAIPTGTPVPTPALTATSVPTPTLAPAPTPTPTPQPTATPVPTPTHQPTATPVPTPTPQPTATPVPTPTHQPTATPVPTPTQVPGRADLYESVYTPEHMTYIWWEWERGRDSTGKKIHEFQELVIDFTIHNDVELEGDNGLYLMLAHSKISDVGFYFGLQTDVYAPEPPYRRGKGLLFSRWETRDLANARFSETHGWAQSSGHEGNFIGVRRSYAWGAGDYRVRLAPDGDPEDDGVWFALWITDRSTDITTWAGSLKFPLLDGKAVMRAPAYSTMEIYGGRIRPIDIPAWHVTIERPLGDGTKSSWGHTGYSPFEGDVMNSEVRYDPDDDAVHFEAGGTTERRTRGSAVAFK